MPRENVAERVQEWPVPIEARPDVVVSGLQAVSMRFGADTTDKARVESALALIARLTAERDSMQRRAEAAEADWQAVEAKLAAISTPPAPLCAPACADDVCLASRQDGILCAEDECDYHSGVRKPATPPAPPETGEVCRRTIEGCICPECGPTWIDEDGCCRSCGADTEPGLVQITMTAVRLGVSPPNAEDADCSGVGPVLPAVSVLEDIDQAFAALKSATGGEYSSEDHTVIDALVNARDFIAAASPRDPREAPQCHPECDACAGNVCMTHDGPCDCDVVQRHQRDGATYYGAKLGMQIAREAPPEPREAMRVLEECLDAGIVREGPCAWTDAARVVEAVVDKLAALRAEGEGGTDVAAVNAIAAPAPAKDPTAATWHAGQMALYRRLETLAAEEGGDAGLIADMRFKADMHQRAAMALSGVGAEPTVSAIESTPCTCPCGCTSRTIAPGRCMVCRVRESCRDLTETGHA